MTNLNVKFKNLNFKNPVIMASGTFGFGKEYGEIYDIEKLGGISSKGLTLNKKMEIQELEFGRLRRE